jgi:hypothetical protein
MLYSFKEQRKYVNPSEIIDLNTYSSVKSSEDTTLKHYSFDIYSRDHVFSLVAADEATKEDWLRCIGRAIVMSRARGFEDEDEDDGY